MSDQKNNRTTRKFYGISRIDDVIHRTHAWRVCLRRQGRTFVKNFPDKSCGGKRKALTQATKYRDDLIRQYPPTTRQQMAAKLRSHNRTGINGVYRYKKSFYLKDGTRVDNWYWEASWPTIPGKNEKIAFSVKKYGERAAKAMAIEARKIGIKDLDGVFWASERGKLEA